MGVGLLKTIADVVVNCLQSLGLEWSEVIVEWRIRVGSTGDLDFAQLPKTNEPLRYVILAFVTKPRSTTAGYFTRAWNRLD